MREAKVLGETSLTLPSPKGGALFEEDDTDDADIFNADPKLRPKPPPVVAPPPPKKSGPSLFGLEDDEDFMDSGASDLFGDLSKAPKAIGGKSAKSTAADDEEEESAVVSKPATTATATTSTAKPAAVKTTEKGKSLFNADDDEDDMFGAGGGGKAPAPAAAKKQEQEEEEEEAPVKFKKQEEEEEEEEVKVGFGGLMPDCVRTSPLCLSPLNTTASKEDSCGCEKGWTW